MHQSADSLYYIISGINPEMLSKSPRIRNPEMTYKSPGIMGVLVWRSYKEGSSVLEHVVAHFGFARFRNFCRLTAMASSQPQKR
jgi:hypothetical protein